MNRTVKLPDGRSVTVNIPDGATDAQVNEFLNGADFQESLKASTSQPAPPAAPAVKEGPPDPLGLVGAGAAATNVLVGAGKGIIETGSNIVRNAPPGSGIGVAKWVAKKFGVDADQLLADPDFNEALKPENTPQKVGKFAERVAEFATGEGVVAQGVKAAPLLAKAPALAQKVISGAASGGGVTAVQGGDAKDVATNAAVGSVAPVAVQGLGKLAGPLYQSALRSYERVLGATKQTNKVLASRSVPRLVEEGRVVMTRNQLREIAKAEKEHFQESIEGLWNAIPEGEAVPAAPVLKAIDDAAARFQLKAGSGDEMVSLDPSITRNFEALRKIITTAADDAGNVDVRKLRRMKQVWDEIVANKGGYAGATLTQAEQTTKREAANGIRRILDEKLPDIAAINREFAFWKNVEDVVASTMQRTAAQTSSPVGVGMARVAGAAMGPSVGTSLVTGEAMGLLRRLVTSPAWGTVSAVTKDRLAKVLVSGNTESIVKILSSSELARRRSSQQQ